MRALCTSQFKAKFDFSNFFSKSAENPRHVFFVVAVIGSVRQISQEIEAAQQFRHPGFCEPDKVLSRPRFSRHARRSRQRRKLWSSPPRSRPANLLFAWETSACRRWKIFSTWSA